MVPFELDTDSKHRLKQVGKKFVFSINGVDPDDAGLYQVEVDGVKIFSTEFKRKKIHQIMDLHNEVGKKSCEDTSCPETGNEKYHVVHIIMSFFY